MDRALDDLREKRAEAAKEETRRASQPQFPYAPAAPPVPTFDISSLATHLPTKERKALLSQITPLAKDRFPEPTDLSAFWLTVEEALRSLHPSL